MLPIPDALILHFDRALRTVFAPAVSRRPHPDDGLAEGELSEAERRHAAGLMRVNHSGEVCAQALYQGQALTARNPEVARALMKASDEETEHLAWCERRLTELGGHKSVLNPLWYTGAFFLGVLAGALGDRWNLGFLAETERQVEAHLDGHLRRLPKQDAKSRAIVEQMKADEIRHARMAIAYGGAELPLPLRLAMKLSAKVMTQTAYWV